MAEEKVVEVGTDQYRGCAVGERQQLDRLKEPRTVLFEQRDAKRNRDGPTTKDQYLPAAFALDAIGEPDVAGHKRRLTNLD